jgi:esterase FrsA
LHLLLEHGGPKAARFYPGGHMGGGDAQAVIVQWLKEKLSESVDDEIDKYS